MSKAKTSSVVFGVGPRNGLGAELCHQAAARGLHVFVNGRTAKKIEAVVEDINTSGGEATALLADVTDDMAVKRALVKIAEHGPLELAIYNAGNNRMEPFLEISPETYETMWRVICFGAFLVSQATLRLMLAQQGKAPRQSLLFTGASGSLRGKADFAAFASGKGALRMMVQSLAREFGPRGIHIGHAIVDGVIKGEKVGNAFPEYLKNLGEDGALNIGAIAQAFFYMHDQHRSAWTQELDLRPFKENF